MSEGEYLYQVEMVDQADDDLRDSDLAKQFEEVSKWMRRYDSNRNAETGAIIGCPTCDKKIIKRSYQTQFCSNKGPYNCKDVYWNWVKPRGKFRHLEPDIFGG
jgi:hypothetical protein